VGAARLRDWLFRHGVVDAVVVTWNSPLFGRVSADGKPVGDQFYIAEHPIVGCQCLIPKGWVVEDADRNGHAVEDVFGLSA